MFTYPKHAQFHRPIRRQHMHLILPQWKNHRCYCVPTKDGPCCKKCRAVGERHADWREAQTGMREFACQYESPSEKSTATVKDSLTVPTVKLRTRAVVSWASAKSFFATIMTRYQVEPEVVAARRVACLKCDYLGTDKDGNYCGAPTGCGCGVGHAPKYFGLRLEGADLTLWEEVGNDLCKHPKRTSGKGWPT